MAHRLLGSRGAQALAVGLVLAALTTGVVYAEAVRKNGAGVRAVRTATSASPASITVSESTPFTWTDLPDMLVNVPIPSGERGLLLITFSGVDHCSGTGGFCQVRVLVNGTEAAPGPVIFDSTEDGGTGNVNSYEVNSMQFVAGPLGAGNHTVKVQYSMSPYSSATFTVISRTLTVLRSKA